MPAWGAVAIAGGASFLGFVVDAARGTELTSAFSSLYIVGVVVAALLVRYRGLFTAMVQAPLILFVAVPLSYQYFTDNPGTSLKDILLNVAIPLVNRFPVMLLGTVLALAIGAARVFLKRQSSHAPAGAAKRTMRDRAQETRDRARENRARMAESRQRRSTPAQESAAEPDTRTRRSRRGAPPADQRRERIAPQVDRPAGDPYRPERDYASDPVRRPVPRPQQPRVPRPPEVDPYSAPRPAATPRATVSAHIPPHPVPQVRYRDRGDA
ncbi:DUF6542 domain-containing protein [Rhodococcoides kyotonense]|uniref:DUF6542 domain-containing protein n=1 Tax=Rhodococcoides kyotonense TaxID=398843 RepID=UPI001FE2E2BA|nr:DUF6542 domain-containing protein [Rhodococcus kyotonensis]